jgi:hypothetical protein
MIARRVGGRCGILTALTVSLLSGAGAVGAAPKVDFDAVVAAAQRTGKKVDERRASWTVMLSAKGHLSSAAIDVTQAGGRRRLVFYRRTLGFRSEEWARLIEREGFWYATDGDRRGKYRPYEACFSRAAISLYRDVADLRFPQDMKFFAGARVEDVTDAGIASVTLPPANVDADAVRGLLKQIRDAAGAKPSSAIAAQIDQLEALLRDGVRVKVDVNSGMITELDTPKFSVSYSGLTFPEKADDAAFAVANEQWEDFTDDPTAGRADLNQFVMIGHDGAWRPGRPNPDVDAELVDLTTGRRRRVPFRGAGSLGGCFAAGRKSVFVAGLSLEEGSLRLFEVDLSTGANRPLGGDVLAAGFTLMPTLSPDGKTLACIHKGLGDARLLEFQIFLIDLTSGEAKPLGKPMDTAFVSWAPDGKSLIALRREHNAAKDVTTKTVCRIDLDGKLTPLFEGDHPLVLGDQRTLLWSGADEARPRKWFLGDLAGRNRRPLGVGLPDLGFPTSSPDGTKLLMMRFWEGEAPEPVILKLGENDVRPVAVGEGLWMSPAWR